MAEEWKRWMERGAKDMCIAREAFRREDYEHAAYMTQQALEKYVKSIWIVGDMGQPKDLKHDIVGHLVSEIDEGLEKCEFGPSSMPKDNVKKNIKRCKQYHKRYELPLHYQGCVLETFFRDKSHRGVGTIRRTRESSREILQE